MTEFTRRESLTLTAAAMGAALLPAAARADDDVPTAKVAPMDLKIEKGAELRVLRPAKFVEADEVWWKANTKKYTDATGIPVKVDFLSWEDIRPQTAVTANTGAGPDIVIGFSSDPQVYAAKLVDITDLANYLGAKDGGWMRLAEI
jgi:multiple sugar transport system substrate-binding protein